MTNQQNVWIIGINYAPDEVGIAPYTTQLADHLVGQGARVHVTTGIPYYPSYRINPNDRWMLSRFEEINGVSVQRLRHTVPKEMTAISRGIHEASFLSHALIRKPPFKPNVIVGVTPALSGAVAAARMADRLDVPLVLIVQDLVGPGALQSGIAGGARVAGLASRLERWALRRASAVTILHDRFVDYVLEAGVPESRIAIFRNWSFAPQPTRPRDVVRRELGWPTDRPAVLYAGNMGLKMALENVIEAGRLAEREREEILFILLGDGSQRPALERAARGLSTVRFESSRYGQAFTETLAAADVLLINERPSMDNMSLPSKLTYYFAAGRPVLAAVAAGGTTALEVELSGSGTVIPPGDPAALLRASLELGADENRCRSLGEAGRAYGATAYARDQILEGYEDLIGAAMSDRPLESAVS